MDIREIAGTVASDAIAFGVAVIIAIETEFERFGLAPLRVKEIAYEIEYRRRASRQPVARRHKPSLLPVSINVVAELAQCRVVESVTHARKRTCATQIWRERVRRRQLIEVGIRLFSQKGFRGTTTKEITDAASVNPAILFRNFPTKDDLYAAILDFKANEINLDVRIDELRKRAERRDDEGLFRLLAVRILEYNRRDRCGIGWKVCPLNWHEKPVW